MILIIGGTGRVGREVVKLLVSGTHKLRVLVRDQARAETVLSGAAVEISSGGINDAGSLRRAMRGVERVLVIPPNLRDQAEVEQCIYTTARSVSVGHVVKLSTVKANLRSACHFFREHAIAEMHLKNSGVDYTILRTNSFMQNLLWFAHEIKSKGTLSLPMGEAQTAPVDVRDLAAVAAAVLSGPAEPGFIYNVTGPERLSFNDIAGELSKTLGKKIAYCDVAPAEFVDMLICSGMSDWRAKSVAAAWTVARTGEPMLTDVISEVANKRPKSFAQFTRDYAAAFKGGNRVISNATI